MTDEYYRRVMKNLLYDSFVECFDFMKKKYPDHETVAKLKYEISYGDLNRFLDDWIRKNMSHLTIGEK